MQLNCSASLWIQLSGSRSGIPWRGHLNDEVRRSSASAWLWRIPPLKMWCQSKVQTYQDQTAFFPVKRRVSFTYEEQNVGGLCCSEQHLQMIVGATGVPLISRSGCNLGTGQQGATVDTQQVSIVVFLKIKVIFLKFRQSARTSRTRFVLVCCREGL